ncbi:MAG: PEP/pyruvate-binding domain-containing protein [Flavobacteriales bacterium]
MYIHPLSDLLEEKNVGGKAASLSKLLRFGVQVPDGFALDKSLYVDFNQQQQWPEEFLVELKQKCASLKSELVIVRSSAIGEDSGSHSFAGQLDSIVVNNEVSEVEKAILTCWKGLQNDRVKAYEQIAGKRLTEMGVVIQLFLEADYAGVTFTQSPTDEMCMYTEYVQGAGEQLVAGKITPKNFSIHRLSSEVVQTPFNSDLLIKQSLHLKKCYDGHLDIEWVSKGNEIYFVQARPITVHAAKKVYWSNTNLNENYPDPISPLLYSIARDSYYHYFKNISKLLQIDGETLRSLEYDFSNTVGIWGNRIYYNMTSIHNVMSSSPLKAYFKEAFNQFVGYSDQDLATNDVVNRTSKWKLFWRLIVLNVRLENHVRNIEGKVTNFSKKVDQEDGDQMNAKLFYAFLDLRFHQWYHASLADFFAMIHYKLLGKLTHQFFGTESVGVHNTLIQAIPGLISSEPLNDIWNLSQQIEGIEGGKSYFLENESSTVWKEIHHDSKWTDVKESIDQYLQNWGFRCSGELMFFKKNYIEEPEKFIELLQSYMRNDAVNPYVVIAKKDLERKKAMRSFVWKIIRKRNVLFPLALFEIIKLYVIASLCKQAIASRERVRYKQAEMYYKFKVVVKRIGEKEHAKGSLENPRDIFYLSYKEIGERIGSSQMDALSLKQKISQRIIQFQEESKSVFPSNFSTNFGDRPTQILDEVPFVAGAKEFKGLAASGGRIKARVKVLESVLEGEKLEKGDILVTKQTDPGWAMVFPIIGGLIVERGGALSHGAIVAREFGIPAVIGIDHITRSLKDNDLVILDGDLGKIQLLDHD